MRIICDPFPAKYSGPCVLCDERYDEGDDVVFIDEATQPVHLNCADHAIKEEDE